MSAGQTPRFVHPALMLQTAISAGTYLSAKHALSGGTTASGMPPMSASTVSASMPMLACDSAEGESNALEQRQLGE